MNNVSAGEAEYLSPEIIDLYEKIESVDDRVFAGVTEYGTKESPSGWRRYAKCVIEITGSDISDELQDMISQATKLGFYYGFDHNVVCHKGEPVAYDGNTVLRISKAPETIIQQLGITLTREVILI